MSTKSKIGLLKNDNIESIYCLFDGYPQGIGKKLLKYYNNIERINQLLSLGDLETLGKFLNKNEYKKECNKIYLQVKNIIGNEKLKQIQQLINIKYKIEKDITKPIDNYSDNNICIYKNIEDFKNDLYFSYGYLYINNDWNLIKQHSKTKEFEMIKLKEIIKI